MTARQDAMLSEPSGRAVSCFKGGHLGCLTGASDFLFRVTEVQIPIPAPDAPGPLRSARTKHGGSISHSRANEPVSSLDNYLAQRSCR